MAITYKIISNKGYVIFRCKLYYLNNTHIITIAIDIYI